MLYLSNQKHLYHIQTQMVEVVSSGRTVFLLLPSPRSSDRFPACPTARPTDCLLARSSDRSTDRSMPDTDERLLAASHNGCGTQT